MLTFDVKFGTLFMVVKVKSSYKAERSWGKGKRRDCGELEWEFASILSFKTRGKKINFTTPNIRSG